MAKKAMKKVVKKTIKKAGPMMDVKMVRPAKSVKKASAKRVVKKVSRTGKSMGLAVVALILNILILPGLGSLIGGKIKAGVWQLVLAIVGAILSIFLIGIPLLLAAWIWGIVTGVRLIQEAKG